MFDLENALQLSKISKLDFDEKEISKAVDEMKPVIRLMDVIGEFEKDKEDVLIKTTSFSELREDLPSEKNNIITGEFSVPKVVWVWACQKSEKCLI